MAGRWGLSRIENAKISKYHIALSSAKNIAMHGVSGSVFAHDKLLLYSTARFATWYKFLYDGYNLLFNLI